MNQRVFVTRLIPEEGLKKIRSNFDTAVWEDDTPPSSSQIINRAKGCAGLVTLLTDDINTEVIQSLPDLKVISQYAVGYDNIDVSAATAKGIIVTNTPGVLTETTADFTWGLIMAISRRIVEADSYVRNGEWKVAWEPQLMLGIDTYGSTLGIIGLGRIGSAVARRAKGFSMKILYHSRTENELTKEIEKETGAIRTAMENLLSESDILTIHVPLTSETWKMIGEKELRVMKKDAVLVNTSRGAILDEKALVNALKSGQLRGAALDVFQMEPLPLDSPLLGLDNVILAPHIGSASISTRVKMSKMCADNMIAALGGQQPPNIVNPKVMEHV